MNKKFAILFVAAVLCLGAATVNNIRFFTDYPNAVPNDTDAFALQRGQSYVYATPAQTRQFFFSNPSFTGNGYIPGQWHTGSILNDGIYVGSGVLYGNGAGLTNVPGISGNFFAATNGIGQNPTFYGGGSFFGTYYFDEVDALNFFPTNFYTGLTNYPVLGTDGNGQLRRADAVAVTFSNQFRVDVTHAFVASNATASAMASFDGANNLTNARITTRLSFTGNTLDLANGDNGSSYTNLTINYKTNAIPTSGALTFGNAYFTNLQASVVLPALTLSAAFYETCVIVATNSTGSDTTFTVPAGVKIALANGGGTTFTVTNKSRSTIVFEHYGTLMTNAWKNDF